MEQREKVRRLIEGLLARKGDQRVFGDQDSLFLSGRLQSVDAVEVVVFAEEEWGIDFSKIGFDMSLIDNVESILVLKQHSEIAG